MLTITLDDSKESVLPFCQENKLVYHPGYYLYVARDKAEILGSGLFEIGQDNVQIVGYKTTYPQDISLFDGVLRSGFNYAGENGLIHGLIPIDFHEKYLDYFSQLNYPTKPNFQINDFFKRYKNCGTL